MSLIPPEFGLTPQPQDPWDSLLSAAPYAILNNLPFIDLFKVSIVSKITSDFRSSAEYFRQRLASFNLGPTVDQNYLSLVNTLDPKDAYVKALVDANLVDYDPTILIYMQKSNVLFFGLETYIGLAKMGLRAIEQNSSEHLLYVLRLHPNKEEMTEVLGTLFLRYWDSKRKGIEYNIEYNILPRETMIKLQGALREGARADRYYPVNFSQFVQYQAGLMGHGYIFERLRSMLTKERHSNLMAYFMGLVDGRHSTVFIEAYNNYDQSDNYYWKVIYGRLIFYVPKYGTVEMVKRLIDEEFIGSFIYNAVTGNNIPVVDYLLSQYSDKMKTYMASPPRSERMVGLLRSHGIDPPVENILSGAIQAGDYTMILKYWSGILSGTNLSSAMERAAPYVIRKYFTDFRMRDDTKFAIDRLSQDLMDLEDLIRLETFFEVGNYEIMKRVNVRKMLIQIDNSKLTQAVGLSYDRYPLLYERI